ncbi:MAG: hypothetical protein WCK13_03045 [Ignavibacteriota bacterium]|nr:hypothetical protein [Ignavibacteriota bacterium]
MNKANLTKLMLTEFYNLSQSDIDIQINRNYDTLKEMGIIPEAESFSKGNDLEEMIQRFYVSLSDYLSRNTGSDYTCNNSNYSSFNSFKRNYLKFLKYNEQPMNKVTT